MSNWVVISFDNQHNVIPLNDTGPHIESVKCACKPVVEMKNGDRVIIHNSYDHRELLESEFNTSDGYGIA